jgi:hypothetical protein
MVVMVHVVKGRQHTAHVMIRSWRSYRSLRLTLHLESDASIAETELIVQNSFQNSDRSDTTEK